MEEPYQAHREIDTLTFSGIILFSLYIDITDSINLSS